MPDKYTIDDWIKKCKDGFFVCYGDHEGVAFLGTNDKQSNVEVSCEFWENTVVKLKYFPDRFSHVWFEFKEASKH